MDACFNRVLRTGMKYLREESFYGTLEPWAQGLDYSKIKMHRKLRSASIFDIHKFTAKAILISTTFDTVMQ